MKQSKKAQKPTHTLLPGQPAQPDEYPTSSARWTELARPIKAWNKVHPAGEQTPLPHIEKVKARGWMLTIPAEGDRMVPQEVVDETFNSEAQAAVYSLEKGKTTGYLHFQAFVYFRSPRHGSALMSDLFESRGVHYEPAESVEGGVHYVCKRDTHVAGPFWLGHPESVRGMGHEHERQSSREAERYTALRAELEKGRRYEDLILDLEWGPWALRHANAIRDLTSALAAERYGAHDRDVSCDYIFGPTRSGKTSQVLDLYDRRTTFIADLSSSFPFDGYSGQEVLLLDDFRGGIPFSELLRVLDRYPLRVNIKGSHTWACWTKVVITSNVKLSELYKHVEESHDPLYRRFENGIVFEIPRPGTKLPYSNREDAMTGKRNDGQPNGMPGFKPAWERTEEEAADAAIDDVFDSLNNA